MKPLVLSQDEWNAIREKIRRDFGESMIMLRFKMKRELGFTPRTHLSWVPKMDGGYFDQETHIDFYTEEARTWFLLKYT
jgi:hypothetical protein